MVMETKKRTIAVCVAAWRSPELSFDYQGVVVGVLSLLVTVLIGWQIYTLFNIRSIQRKLPTNLKTSGFP